MRIIRIGRMPAVLGISRVAFWELRKSGKFIPARRISPGVIGWLEEDVRAWLDSRPTVDFTAPRGAA